MSRKKEPPTAAELTAEDDADAHPDLKALVRAVRRRDRQFVVARLLVEEFARMEGEDPDAAWHRYRRALEIDRVSALGKGELARTDLAALIAGIAARSGGG